MKKCDCRSTCQCKLRKVTGGYFEEKSPQKGGLNLQYFLEDMQVFPQKQTVFPKEEVSPLTGPSAHKEGKKTEALGSCSHAEGEQTISYSENAHSEGFKTIVRGENAHAEGSECQANGFSSHGEGSLTQANGFSSHSEGNLTQANGFSSHSEGQSTIANGLASHAGGAYTIADNDYSTAIGRYNNPQSKNTAFMIGNGNAEIRSNAFTVNFTGETSTRTTFHAGGMEYAQMFEWADENVEGVDRTGHFVTLEDGKIRIAAEDSHYILGVVAAVPALISNSGEQNWERMYLKDEWGRLLLDSSGYFIPTPDFDDTKLYISRCQRPEWAAVGLLGQTIVLDDGSCRPNSFCKPSKDGIATASEEGYFVMRRLSENQVVIILK